MTPPDPVSITSTVARLDDLPSELVDAIGEAVFDPRDASARSIVVSSMVREICESIEWIHGHDAELTSLRMVLDAALDHQVWMADRGASTP